MNLNIYGVTITCNHVSSDILIFL